MAVLFTGVGDTLIYRNTGHDVTGMAAEKYHKELQEESRQMREKAAALPKTTVEIDSAKYDFGAIAADQKVEHTYKLKNTGTENLIIADVRVGCGCTVADYSQEPVPPGAEAEVSIIFDPTGKSGHTQKALHVYSNTENIPLSLAFTADILSKE